MSDSAEAAKDIAAFATAPVGGILLGSAVTPATCGFDGAVVCENWFGSTLGGLVGDVNPDAVGWIAGIVILGLASLYVYLHHRATGAG